MRALTPVDVARRPAPGTTVPSQVRYSPDGSTITFLLAESGSLRQQLWSVDVATGTRTLIPAPGAEVSESDLSLEERLRRERARDLGTGVTRTQWAAEADRLLVPMGDGLWLFDTPLVVDGEPRAPRRVLAADHPDLPGPILDARLCADGSTIGFVSGDEVWIVGADGGAPRPVTDGAAGTGRTNGLAEYVAQEEMGRAEGFWLDPTGSRVAYCEVDETHIPIYRIVHQGADAVGDDAQEDHRYPFAGAANARVRLAVRSTADDAGPAVWVDLGCSGIDPADPGDRYLARVHWAGSDTLLVQITDREQRRLDVLAVDAVTGEARMIHTERSEIWINLHDHLRVRTDDGETTGFLWVHERDGMARAEIRDLDGRLRIALAAPDADAVLVAVHAVTDTDAWVTFTHDLGLGRRLHRVPLDGSAAATVDPDVSPAGPVAVAPDGTSWVAARSSQTTPPRTELHRGDAEPVVLADAGDDPRLDEVSLRPPALHRIAAADGATPLNAAVWRPDGDGPFPLVVWVYGGPHAQLVTEGWTLTARMQAQYLCQEGFVVAVCDGRGSWNRGLHFEGALANQMGTVEIDDQVALVEHLVADGLVDPARVGIVGWSYGGYLAALGLARRPDVFRAACAGAPVTDWDGYDTHYTERYLGTPTSNPDGYRQGSVLTHVEGLRDRDLLIVHGLIDENVHFRHSARLIDRLVKADIDHRLLLYPDERHSPRSEADRASMERQIADFFRRSLQA